MTEETESAAAAPLRRWLIVVPLIVGAVLFALLAGSRERPRQLPATEIARAVRIIEVPALAVVPRALAFGTVRPATVWEGIAEVAGRVIEVHPDLDPGATLPAGSVLLRIDPVDYELALAQADADTRSVEAQLAEIDTRETNTRLSLDIERSRLELAEAELDRQRTLANQGTVSRSTLDSQARDVLAQSASVQTQRNALNLIPAERRVLQAQLARLATQRATATRNIERTTLRLPFEARIAESNVELHQFVAASKVLVVADDIAVAEIVVQLPIAHMRGLVGSGTGDAADVTPADVVERLGLTARVKLPEADATWDARFTRVSATVDPKTRTVGLILQVDEPYRRAVRGKRPPLVKGMFVEVVLSAPARPDSRVIPRSALHGDTVYIANPHDRLERRRVEVVLVQPEFVTIGAGVETGERIILTDLAPAIEGMLLAPVIDAHAAATLTRLASGAP